MGVTIHILQPEKIIQTLAYKKCDTSVSWRNWLTVWNKICILGFKHVHDSISLRPPLSSLLGNAYSKISDYLLKYLGGLTQGFKTL